MSKYRLRIFCDGYSSEHCKIIYERLSEIHLLKNYGRNNEIYITMDDDYTHAILINTTMPKLIDIPKENVVGFAHEPVRFLPFTPEFIEYAQKYIGKYFLGDKHALPPVFIEKYSYVYYMKPLNYTPVKTKTVSMIVSKNMSSPGTHYQHILCQQILAYNLPIDIYGHGSNMYEYDTNPNARLKGMFTDVEPYESYDFHICIDDFVSNRYFSDRIINSLLCGTTPIYLGCRNINHYFPKMSIQLTGKVDIDISMLRIILENPSKYKKNINIEDVKKKVNLLQNLDDVFPKTT